MLARRSKKPLNICLTGIAPRLKRQSRSIESDMAARGTWRTRSIPALRRHSGSFDGTHSSNTQLISHVLNSESLAAASTIMIGDRAHDVVGALANGIRPIGALWGYGS